jgi:glutathione S-transferase
VELYFSPMACSLASRIAVYESDAEAGIRFVEVDPKTKRTEDGADYRAIYPLGLVPLIRFDDGSLLSENAAILQYLAGLSPGLAPQDALGRARLQQWLCFIGTELHKALFIPLFDAKAPQGTREHALSKQESRLAFLDRHLKDREYLLDAFTVADAYLYTVLNWSVPTQLDLTRWPAIEAYHKALQARPRIARATREEYSLYQAEVARHEASRGR